MSLLSTKFHEILLCGFRGVAMKRTGLTDGQVKNIIHDTIDCMGYNNIYNLNMPVQKEWSILQSVN